MAESEQLTFAEIMDALLPAVPMLSRLDTTPQDAQWHAEGNVAVHSALVVEQAHDLADEAGLVGPERAALILSAALHDIGKALTTREEADDAGVLRIRSPRHARRGRDYLAYRLLDAGLPPPLILTILALTTHHHSLHRAHGDALGRGVWALARRVPLPLLVMLARADARGRVVLGSDAIRGEDAADLLELAARDLGLWNRADPYADFRSDIHALLPDAPTELLALATGRGIADWEAGLIHTPHEAVARVQGAARQGFPRLTVLCGPSGSGKSTLAQADPDAQVVSLDALRARLGRDSGDQSMNGQVMQAAREAVRVGLRRHAHVIWDATSLRRDQRAQVLRLGEDYGALTRVHVAWASPAQFTARNAARLNPVPGAVLAAQLDTLEFPAAGEAHDLLLYRPDGQVIRGHQP